MKEKAKAEEVTALKESSQGHEGADEGKEEARRPEEASTSSTKPQDAQGKLRGTDEAAKG